MRRRTVFRRIAAPVLIVVVLSLAAYLAFVPSAKEPGYDFVTSWGTKGNGPGQFHDPTGVAVAGDEVFVADSRNGRIQVFDLDGNFLRAFGEPGDAKGQLGRPMNLTVGREAGKASSTRRAVLSLPTTATSSSPISTISGFSNFGRTGPSSDSGEPPAKSGSVPEALTIRPTRLSTPTGLCTSPTVTETGSRPSHRMAHSPISGVGPSR